MSILEKEEALEEVVWNGLKMWHLIFLSIAGVSCVSKLGTRSQPSLRNVDCFKQFVCSYLVLLLRQVSNSSNQAGNRGRLHSTPNIEKVSEEIKSHTKSGVG